ncbi:MAG: hypothetical protein NVV62_08890 [Terricaulis sp.]|nr:hypothetical protein [Terricaulis sp.]
MKWFSFERAMPVLFIIGYVIFYAYQVTLEDIGRMFDAFWGPVRALIDRF